LVAESRRAVKKLSRDMGDLAARRDCFGASSMASNVKKQHAAALNKACKSGLYRSVAELERARKHALTAIARRYDTVRDAAKKHAFEHFFAIGDGELLAVMESAGADPEQASARPLSRIHSLRGRELARVRRKYDVLVQRSEKCHGDIFADVRNNVKKWTFELEEKYGRVRQELAEQEKLLGERENGSF
jgi:rubrerythrin